MANFQRDNVGAFDFGRLPPSSHPSHPLFGKLSSPPGSSEPNHPSYISHEEPQTTPYDPTDPNIPSSTQVETSIPQVNPVTTTPPLVHTTLFQTPFSQASASTFGQPQQFTTGMPPMGPTNQPFITPSLFTSAQNTIPSFPLDHGSSVQSATNPQSTTFTPSSYYTPQATTNVLSSSQLSHTPPTTLPNF